MEQVLSNTAYGVEILEELTKLSKEYYKNKLISCYAIGSLAHGGFSPTTSDVDFAIILSNPWQSNYIDIIKQINREICTCGLKMANKASIYYGSVETMNTNSSYIRFPGYDKLDLIIHGKLLYGQDIRTLLVAPTTEEIEIEGITQIVERFEIDKATIEINQISNLILCGQIPRVSKLILLPIRFLYTIHTNLLAHNIDSVAYFEKNTIDNNKIQLVNFAYTLRNLSSPYAINTILKQFQAIPYAQENLRVLYKEFIELYYSRLIKYGKNKLANELLSWLINIQTNC